MKPLADRTGVEDCAAGTFSEGGADTCTSCGSNSYSSAGSLFCYSCIPGQRYNSESAACVNCDRNKYNSNGNGNSCNDCATNSYSNPGSPSCYTCSSGTEYSIEDLQCALCAAAKFSETGVQCFPCEVSERASERGSVYNNNPTSLKTNPTHSIRFARRRRPTVTLSTLPARLLATTAGWGNSQTLLLALPPSTRA